ncbi:MAG TPA: hypothetical protein VKU82_10295, partial [Planctomycetaceae bacterium]|nr:hypothetical protein [Planctomycetaceae bacterium]
SKLSLRDIFPPGEKNEISAVPRAKIAAQADGGVPDAAAADDEPASNVTGTLVSARGEPLVEFKVRAFRQSGRMEETFVSDRNGEIRVPADWFKNPLFAGEELICIARDEAGGLAWFQIPSSGARSQTIGKPEKPGPFQLALLPIQRTIKGRVLGPDKQPLAGVSVQIQSLRNTTNGSLFLYGFGMTDELPLPSATTDDAGRFRLAVPNETEVTLFVMHPAWVVRRLRLDNRDDVGDLNMIPAGRISGKVVFADTGRPVKGIAVSASRLNAIKRRGMQRVRRGEDPEADFGTGGFSVTDAEGKYEIGGLKDDPHDVQVSAGPENRELLGSVQQGVNVQAGEATTLDLTVQKGRRVRGMVVVGDSGRPVLNCHVDVSVTRDKEHRVLVSSARAKTNDRGAFECYVLPGFARIRVETTREETLKRIPESTVEVEITERDFLPPIFLKLREPTPAELRKVVLQPTLRFGGSNHFVKGFAFDRKGETLVTAGWLDGGDLREALQKGTTRGELRLWNAKSAAEIARFEGEFGGLSAVGISPDRTTLATAGHLLNSRDGEVRIWDFNTRQTRDVLKGHTNTVLAVVYSPDGKFLVSGSFDRTARIWNVTTGNELAILPQSSTPNFLHFDRDGRTLLVGCRGGSIKLYDVGTWTERLSLETKGFRLFDVDISTDGTVLAAAGVPYEADGDSIKSSTRGIIWTWDAATGEERLSWRTEGQSSSIAFSPNGKLLADARHTSSVWDV